MMYYIIISVISYLIGSVNSAIIVSKKLYATDIRSHGSGNAGATNTLRTLGKKAAAIVFAFDFLKGLFSVGIAWLLIYFFDAPYECLLFAGFFVQLGHCLPIFFNFKGGKGVATAAGTAIGIMPFVAILLLAIFAVIALSSKVVSLASGVCATLYPLFAYFLTESHNTENFLFAASCSVLIIVMHTANISRLLTENEKPFSAN